MEVVELKSDEREAIPVGSESSHISPQTLLWPQDSQHLLYSSCTLLLACISCPVSSSSISPKSHPLHVWQVDVRLTSDLKQVLLDESEAYSRGLKGPKLPRTPSVADILLKYVESERGFRHSTDVQEQVSFGPVGFFCFAIHQNIRSFISCTSSSLSTAALTLV